MPTKKKTEIPATNVNNNTNHITVNVEHPKAPLTQTKKTNWVVKAIVLGAITLGLSLLGYFIKAHFDGQTGGDLEIHNSVPIQPNH